MKIALKHQTIFFGLFLLIGAAPAAYAADNSSPPPMPSPDTSAMMASARPDAMAIMATRPDAPAMMPASAPALPASSSSAVAANEHAKLSTLENNVTDSVKSVVKQLSTIDSVNLDDLNTARQAVVKLEILIDIEKHLAELDKIHGERSGGDKAIAAAIPASALAAPPSLSRIPPAESSMAAPPSSSGHNEVSRISGAAGHYTALVQGKSVRVGDSLPDGSKVVAIAAKEVTAKTKDGTVRQLKVKGVDEVYGHTL